MDNAKDRLISSALVNGVPLSYVIRALERIGYTLKVKYPPESIQDELLFQTIDKLVKEDDPFAYFIYIAATFGCKVDINPVNDSQSSGNDLSVQSVQNDTMAQNNALDIVNHVDDQQLRVENA